MVRKRLDKRVSDKVKFVEELILLSQKYRLPQLRVEDVVILNIIQKQTVTFTKNPNGGKVGDKPDEKQLTPLQEQDTLLFGYADDYKDV